MNPPVIVRGESFTIYGEIHNQIDNRFYERLYPTLSSRDKVLLEKTTNPELLRIDEMAFSMMKARDLKRYLKEIGGSEWMYTMGLKDGKPFIPIDIRIESGMPSSREAADLPRVAMTNPDGFIAYIREKLNNILRIKEQFNQPYVKERYNEFLPVILSQLRRYILDASNEVIDEENLDKLLTNLKYIGVFLVDSYIMKMMLENERSPVPHHLHIFVGARHALNLYEMLRTIDRHPTIEQSTELEPPRVVQ